MITELYDHPARFLVSSDSEPETKYLVDLLENQRGDAFFACCQCPHYQFRLQPVFDSGGVPGICKHIAAARGMFFDLMLRTVHKATNQPRPHDDEKKP